jgi:GNAT superfamily N-acetyltransferase
MSTSENSSIRPARPEDADSISPLSAELGYPVPVELMRERIFRMAPENAVFVWESEGRVLGWIGIATVFHIQTGIRAEIGGFVVSPEARSQGIGRLLLQRAEEWARSKGMPRLLVRSNSKREDAHRFYLRENYTQLKTSLVFEKYL